MSAAFCAWHFSSDRSSSLILAVTEASRPAITFCSSWAGTATRSRPSLVRLIVFKPELVEASQRQYFFAWAEFNHNSAKAGSRCFERSLNR